MKRLMSILLVAAMLLSIPVMPVGALSTAREENITAGTELCPCGCGLALEAVQWEPWTVNDTGAPASGHYYLTEDYAQSQEHTIATANSVVIDLRGKTLTTADYTRLFTVNGYLAVLDTVGGGRMCAKTPGTSQHGGVVYLAVSGSGTPTFDFYNATLTQDTDNKSANYGGLVYLAKGCYFNMYGGKLIGATANRGGALYIASSTAYAQLVDSSMIGCSATKSGGGIYSLGNLTLKNCTLIGCETGDYGGNIYAYGGSLTVSENTLIESGVSHATSKGGGNVYATNGCEVSITDSTIRNGYAAVDGGNVFFAKGTQTLTNVTITGGVCGSQGANLCISDSSAVTTLNGCSISGDVCCSAGSLTLKGATKIGLNNYGLTVASAATLTTSGLTSGAEIYTDSASASGTYFKTDYCPHCHQQATWSELSDTASGHCYLSADQTITSAYEITSDTVVDLRGCSITSSDRAFAVAAGAKLTLLDSVGGGAVQGSGNADGVGGVISNVGTLDIHGGSYVYAPDAEKAVTKGGVVYTAGTMNLYGGIMDGSAYDRTSDGLGGAICQDNGTFAFTMTAGKLLGGSTYRGGCIYFGYNNQVNITGGQLTGGNAAADGGNIRLHGTSSNKNGTATISGIRATGGSATTSGGGIQISYYTASVADSWIDGGTASSYGGNISLAARAYVTMTNCVLTDGSAPKGGNLYIASYLSSLDCENCLITNGKATSDFGGNVFANHGMITFKGGEISYGTSKSSGGNFYNNAGDYDGYTSQRTQFTTDSSGGTPLIVGGTSGRYGGNIYSEGNLELLAAFVGNGSAASHGNDLYYTTGTVSYTLTVGAGLQGDISMYVSSDLLGTNVLGEAVKNTTATAFPATLTLEGDYGEPAIIEKDGKLYVELPFVGVATVVTADGAETWYADNASAIAACPEDGYVRLYADGELVMTKDCFVDLNGYAVSVSGDYTLYGMDSSGDGYTVGTGSATWEDTQSVKTATIADAPNGNKYVAVVEDNAVTYHRLGMGVTTVSLRTSACGIYYKVAYYCDSVLASKITSYGVVFSVNNMPGADFLTEKGDINLYTSCTPDADFGSGTVATSGSVFNIMKEDNEAQDNADRGEMAIYANPYVVTGGEVTVGDTVNAGKTVADDGFDGIACSLLDVMTLLDEKLASDPTNYRRYTMTLRSFYEQWKEAGMQDWQFEKIPEPEDDDVIDVLMIGSSYCYYYVEELYALAQAAGVKMRVCNVYYSGGKLEQHYNWWVNNESNYEFFVTDGNGRVQYKGVGLEYCLAQGDWDVISLQEAPSAIRAEGVEAHLATTATYTDALIPYLQEQFPAAEVCWHQTWAVQIGYDRNGYAMETAQQQEESMQMIREYSLAICEKYGLTRINTGEAWQIVRRGGYDNLCARLAINNGEGDYYHDGDIGGGQYLNACVWFEILTGQSCVGNTYVPTYSGTALDADFIATLQNAAHEAVEALNN